MLSINSAWIVENTSLNDCFYEKKDWRACKKEVCLSEVFELRNMSLWIFTMEANG